MLGGHRLLGGERRPAPSTTSMRYGYTAPTCGYSFDPTPGEEPRVPIKSEIRTPVRRAAPGRAPPRRAAPSRRGGRLRSQKRRTPCGGGCDRAWPAVRLETEPPPYCRVRGTVPS